MQRLARGVADERPADERDDGAAVAGAHSRFELERAGLTVAPLAGDPLLGGGGAFGELQRAHQQQLVLGPPEQLAERAVDAAEAAVRLDDRHAGGRVAERLAESFGVVLVTTGDVARDDVAEAGVVIDDGADLGPANLGARPHDPHAELLVADLAVGRDDLEDVAHARQVIGVDDVPEHAGQRGVLVTEQQPRGRRIRPPNRPVDTTHDEGVGGECEQALFERVLRYVRKVVHRWSSPPGVERPRVRIGRFAHNS